MSNFIERILGVKPFEDEINDLDEVDYLEHLRREREKLKEKTFNTEEDLTYDEFIRLIDIVKNKFINSFGCFENDYEFVIRKKVNKPQKKKKESENGNYEKSNVLSSVLNYGFHSCFCCFRKHPDIYTCQYRCNSHYQHFF